MKAGIKLGIIGLGVIGASLGMAVRHSKADIKVWGNDIDPETESAALEMGAVDGLLSNDNLGECDIVIIAAPLSAVPEILIQIKDRLKAGATVSDVGSVKGWIMENYNRLLPPGINFIGGHPMAGSEKSGISAADKFLLQNAAYILTPHGSTPPDILTTLAEILSLAGARVIVMNAADHDRAVAKVSHLPHLMAAAVINNLQGHSSALALAGGGLRDTTRTASSSPALWQEILMYNANSVCEELEQIIARLTALQKIMENRQFDRLHDFLDSACQAKKSLPSKRPCLDDSCDIVAIIPDHPGVIGRLGILLGENEINIHDIQLLGVRDEDEGTIRITVNRDNAEKSCGLLKDNGFPAWIRE